VVFNINNRNKTNVLYTAHCAIIHDQMPLKLNLVFDLILIIRNAWHILSILSVIAIGNLFCLLFQVLGMSWKSNIYYMSVQNMMNLKIR